MRRNAGILEVPIDTAAIGIIAGRARCTPRIANRLLKRVRDFAQVRHNGEISEIIANSALDMLNVDQHGLDQVDRKILSSLIEQFNGGPVGLNTLSAAVAEEMETIEMIYEPYLLQIGMIERTPRGRKATTRAYDHLRKAGGAGTAQNSLL